MQKIFYKILLLTLFSILILLFDNYHFLGTVYFYAIIAYITFSIFENRKIKLIDIWNIAFVYIILSEVFVPHLHSNESLPAIKYLLIANNVVNIGYISLVRNKFENKVAPKQKLRGKKYIPFLLFAMVVCFFLLRIQLAVSMFFIGRVIAFDESDVSFLYQISSSLGLLLPSLIMYYYLFIAGKKIWIPLLLSTPIFLILFLEGTRFTLLFSLLGMIVIILARNNHYSIKQYIVVIVSAAVLMYATVLMKHLRSPLSNYDEFSLISENGGNVKDIPTFLATTIMSPEGVIDMTNLLFDYFDKNNHLYGKSSTFILFFWVPRTVWEDKPTMLGHWLIRRYRGGFSDGHSASFGFTGDLYADFGYLSLFFLLIVGRLLKYAENYKNWTIKNKNYSLILGAMMYPYTFFFVRSPITATMTLFGIAFFYFLFKKIFFRSI